MKNGNVYKKAFEVQNKFLLKLINDERISLEIRKEYIDKYNKLLIKVEENYEE